MGRWFNAAAVEWVIHEAGDVPRELLSVLIVVASHAGRDGRGAHPSASTVGTLTRKSERQAKRDLDKLEELGLLSPGDPRVVAHLRSDMRPNVYDLPPDACEYIGQHRKRGDTHDTPHGVTPMTPRGPNGVTPVTERGDTGVSSGVSPMSPEKLYEELSEKNVPANPSRRREDRPDVDRLCGHLADRIEGNGARRPNITQKWRDAARLMLDADKRTEEQVRAAIDWCQDHEFWRANILSMPKLREKYDQLRMQAARGRTQDMPATPPLLPTAARPRPDSQSVAEALRVGIEPGHVAATADGRQRHADQVRKMLADRRKSA